MSDERKSGRLLHVWIDPIMPDAKADKLASYISSLLGVSCVERRAESSAWPVCELCRTAHAPGECPATKPHRALPSTTHPSCGNRGGLDASGEASGERVKGPQQFREMPSKEKP